MPPGLLARRSFRHPGPRSLGLVAVLVAASAAPPAPPYTDHTNLLTVRNAAGAETPLRTRDDWEVRRSHILAHVQEVMGPLPGDDRKVPLDVRVIETVDGPTYVRRKLTFASEPGDRVPAWLFVPKSRKGKRPAALCLHQTVAIGKDEPAGLGGKPNLHYAKELAERGWVVVAPDYPNFGDYKIDVYARGYASASMKAIWNNRRAVDLLNSLEEVDPDRIAAIGHSLGGHNAIFTALFEPRIRAVVSSCGFNSFRHYYHGNIAGWSHRGYMPRLKDVYHLDLGKVPFDFPELIGALAPRAFFTNSPTHDANFEVEGVQVCMRAAEPVYRLYGAGDRLRGAYPDAEHDFPTAQRNEAYEFLDRVLGPGTAVGVSNRSTP